MPTDSPVVVDGQLTTEKISELLALETEYPELEFKIVLDVSTTEDKIYLARHVGAMQVNGGYILIGVDNNGRLTGEMDDVETRSFDSANLKQSMLRYLPRPLVIHSTVVERSNRDEDETHTVVAIYIGPNRAGCAIFESDGAYREENGEEKKLFSMGDIYWRDGTRSIRLSQEGFERVVQKRVDLAKEDWVAEQSAIRRQEREDLELAHRGRQQADGPLGSIDLDMSSRELSLTTLDLARRGDEIAIQHLLSSAEARARTLIDRGDEGDLGDLLDKLICVVAGFLEYRVQDWFDRVIETLVRIYGTPISGDEALTMGYRATLTPETPGPRVWLQIIERIVALGALAVRTEKWEEVRKLTLQLPAKIAANDYDQNWLRHGLTMASRASHLEQDNKQLSLLTLARNQAVSNECLRIDGVGEDDDLLLSSIAQFDFLSNVAAIDGARDKRPRSVFYPSFARFYQQRIQGAADRLLIDSQMRSEIFSGTDAELAETFQIIGESSQTEGWKYDGFDGFEGTPVGDFILENLPEDKGTAG